MGDLISRQAAIKWCRPEEWGTPDERWRPESEFGAMLEALPPAQQERKTGKWIYAEDEHGIDGYHCNQCGFFVPWDYTHKFINYIEDYHYCPNCGSYNGSDEE